MKAYGIVASAALGASILALGGCSSSPSNNPSSASPTYGSAPYNSQREYSPQRTVRYGVVEDVSVTSQSHAPSGVGAVAGAVIGGVLGHQVGGGTGNTVATIAGAAGGAVAGNAIEKNRAGSDSSYRISVRMNDGSRETYDQEANPDMLRAGDLARIENGRVYRR